MEDLPAPFSPGVETFVFRVHFMSIPVGLKQRDVDDALISSNRNEIKSDMRQCAKDFLAFWVQDHEFDMLDIIKTTTATFFEDETEDRLSGCYIDITYRQAFSYNVCAIPASDVPPPPEAECLPATYQNSNESFVQEIASGGTFEALDIIITINGIPQPAIPANVNASFTFPCPPPAINTASIYKTGADAINFNYDDAFLKRGRGTDFYNLDFDNPHLPHNKAYTGKDGGYHDEVTDDYRDKDGNITTEALAFPDGIVLCWKSYDQVSKDVFCVDYNQLSGVVSTTILGAGASGYTRGGFAGFYVCNMKELDIIYNEESVKTGFNWKPFSFIIGAGGATDRVYSSTPFGTNYKGHVNNAVTNQLTPAATAKMYVGAYLNVVTDFGL
jgi:hypothetical protein